MDQRNGTSLGISISSEITSIEPRFHRWWVRIKRSLRLKWSSQQSIYASHRSRLVASPRISLGNWSLPVQYNITCYAWTTDKDSESVSEVCDKCIDIIEFGGRKLEMNFFSSKKISWFSYPRFFFEKSSRYAFRSPPTFDHVSEAYTISNHR